MFFNIPFLFRIAYVLNKLRSVRYVYKEAENNVTSNKCSSLVCIYAPKPTTMTYVSETVSFLGQNLW